MKNAVYIIVIVLISFYTDLFSQAKKERPQLTADTISVDTVQYELLIIDPGFDTWLLTKPAKQYYSKDYYEYRNRLDVSEWNYRYTSNKNHGEYDSYIDYYPETDYGLDLNYKLFYYFRYFEEKYRTKLSPAFR
jgi:hypothetical protein